MGCGSSRITVVEPVKNSDLDKDEQNTLHIEAAGGGTRGDSAVSKHTTDSGVGLDAGEGTALPGAVPRLLPPLRAAQSPRLNQESVERPKSSEIMEQLLSQGIIPAQSKTGGSGEAYNIMIDDAERRKRRPPARLESLKIQREQEVTRKEDIDEKMRQVEERRKVREEELKTRLRAKSARPRAVPPAVNQEDDGVETLQAPAPAPPPVPTRTQDPQTRASGAWADSAEDAEDSQSLELEKDFTFQQNDNIEELF
ncbi:stathmin domain-containing protein 1 [Chanos chanos]|uniref:Stathmin domain-containing protein 1 n=1 Tax=Chanos chanos TaxID=29144 RepID=A0A6J2WFV9_CHACN|nr:stathmin domain-containing protein 1 [Chanos chanos]